MKQFLLSKIPFSLRTGFLYCIIATLLVGIVSFRGITAGGTNTYIVDTSQAGRVATFFFTTSSPSFSANSPAAVTITLDTGGAVIAQSNIILTFTPELVKNVSLSFEKSNCASVKTNTVSNTTGIITLQCERFNAGTIQLQPLATLHFTPTGIESPVFRITNTSSVTSTRNQDVLRLTQAYIASVTDLSGSTPNRVIVADMNNTAGGCISGPTASFEWLKDPGVAKFLYGWQDGAPIDPTTSTISTNSDFPLKTNATEYLTIKAITDSGAIGPIHTERVVSCP